jgi:hypothetical protein
MKKYIFKTKTLAPITHTEEVSSNISSLFRQKMVIDNKLHEVPCVHGNAIRGVLRRLGASHLCEAVGVGKNQVKLEKYFMLFNGGFLEKSLSYCDVTAKTELRALLPWLSVFGSAIGNEMLQGKLIVSFATPSCAELGNGEVSYHDLTQVLRYTRKDDTEQKTDKTSQMFYDGETIIPGVELNWEIQLDSNDELEISALEHTLKLFAEKPYIGGTSRAGHGKIDFVFEADTTLYEDYLLDNQGAVCRWLTS